MFTSAVEDAVLRELEALRQQVKALQPPGKLLLSTLQTAPFLGQSVTLTVSATDLDGQPLIDTPLTLVATWGNLRTTHELIPQQATSLMTRTDAQGQATLLLLPPTSEDLIADQQEALETFLSLLKGQAETPLQTQDSLTEMVNLYNWDANVAYRQAVDIYFRDFGQGLLESVNAYDYLQSWSFQTVTVMALLQPDASTGDSNTQAIASLTLRFKNWLAPWLETYLAVTQQDNPLGESLGIIKERGEAGSVVEGIYDRLQNFIDYQPGIVGQYMGRKVAATSINDFLNVGIDDLDVTTKVALASSLNAASKTLQTVGVGGLAGIAQARTEFTQVVTDTVGQNNLAIADLTDRLGSVTTQVDRFQTNLSDLQTNIGTVDGRVGAIATQVTTLNTSLTDANRRLTTLNSRFDTLNTTVTGINDRIGTLNTRVEDIQTNFNTVNNRVGEIQTQFARDQTTLVGRVDRLQRGQTTFETSLGGLTTRVDGIQQNITTLDGRVGTLTTQFNAVQTTVTRIDTQVGTLQTNFSRIDTQLGGLQTNLGRLNDQVSGFQNRFTTIDAQVGGLQTNMGRLNDQVSGFQNRFTGIDSRLGGLQDRVGVIDSRVGGLQGNFDRFTRSSISRIRQLEDSVTRVGNLNVALRTDFENRMGG